MNAYEALDIRPDMIFVHVATMVIDRKKDDGHYDYFGEYSDDDLHETIVPSSICKVTELS